PILEINRRQADVLEGCEGLFNDRGTAPGMCVTQRNKTYVIMPAVPIEMKHIMQARVLPRLRRLRGRITMCTHTPLAGGIGESFLAEKIADIETALPAHIRLAYLPKPGLVRLRLSAAGPDLDALKRETEQLADKLKTRIGDYFLTEGDTPLESLILTAMQREG